MGGGLAVCTGGAWAASLGLSFPTSEKGTKIADTPTGRVRIDGKTLGAGIIESSLKMLSERQELWWARGWRPTSALRGRKRFPLR